MRHTTTCTIIARIAGFCQDRFGAIVCGHRFDGLLRLRLYLAHATKANRCESRAVVANSCLGVGPMSCRMRSAVVSVLTGGSAPWSAIPRECAVQG